MHLARGGAAPRFDAGSRTSGLPDLLSLLNAVPRKPRPISSARLAPASPCLYGRLAPVHSTRPSRLRAVLLIPPLRTSWPATAKPIEYATCSYQQRTLALLLGHAHGWKNSGAQSSFPSVSTSPLSRSLRAQRAVMPAKRACSPRGPGNLAAKRLSERSLSHPVHAQLA